MIHTLTRAARWLHRYTRGHHHPIAKPCHYCAHHSRNHPAGPLARYTRLRHNGQPVCARHNLCHA